MSYKNFSDIYKDTNTGKPVAKFSILTLEHIKYINNENIDGIISINHIKKKDMCVLFNDKVVHKHHHFNYNGEDFIVQLFYDLHGNLHAKDYAFLVMGKNGNVKFSVKFNKGLIEGKDMIRVKEKFTKLGEDFLSNFLPKECIKEIKEHLKKHKFSHESYCNINFN